MTHTFPTRRAPDLVECGHRRHERPGAARRARRPARGYRERGRLSRERGVELYDGHPPARRWRADDRPAARVGQGNAGHVRRPARDGGSRQGGTRAEENTSEPQSLMRISYAVFYLKNKNTYTHT